MPRYRHGRICGPGRMRRMRRIAYLPEITFYKPQGIPMPELEIVVVSYEEMEAIRLIDFLGMDQEAAAQRMDISRKSLAGDLQKGRRKIADAVLHGKAIRIEGGSFVFRRDENIRNELKGVE